MKPRALILCLLIAGACTIQASKRDVLQASLTAAAPAALEPAGTSDAATAAPAATATTAAAAEPTPIATAQPAAGAAAAAADPTAAADAAEPAAAAPAKPAAAAAATALPTAPAKPAPKEPEWVQTDGFVPVPRPAPTAAPKGTAGAAGAALDVPEEEPAAPAARPAALPPANSWAIADDTEQEDQKGIDVADVFADPRMAPKAAGDTPVVSAQSALGGDMPTGGVLGSAAAPSTDVFASGSSNELPNTYKPSPMSALSANDLIAKMTIDNDQQELVSVADYIRAAFANVTGTIPANVFWYQTRTTQSAGGKPQVQASLLFKNQGAVDRSRQTQALLNPDIIAGISRNVAKYNIKIVPGSVTTSTAVNDASGDTGMMPGAMGGLGAFNATPGFGMGGMNSTGLGLPGFGMGGFNTTAAPAVTEPSPSPAPKSGAGAAVAGLLLPAVMAVAAVML